MKKSKIILLSFSILIASVLAGCAGLDKMKKEAANIKYKVTPEVLEEYVDMVEVKISVAIPEKYFDKNAIVVATPVLKFQDGEKAFSSKTLQGEKVLGNNTVVPFEAGKIITYTGEIPYQDAMRISDLEIRLNASKGEASLDLGTFKIADGVIATATLVQNTPSVILGKDSFERITPESKFADLHYLINSDKIRWSETKAEDMQALKKYIAAVKKDENKKLKSLEISAYASPDGEEDFNEELVKKRENSSLKFIKKQMKQTEVDDLIKTKTTPEDWKGFEKLMKESNIKDKELILRVLSMYSDPEVREREIRNISAAYNVIDKEILPKLRKANFIVNVDLIGKTDEELKELVLNNPTELTVEELLFAANLLDSDDDKSAVFETCKTQFPEDWRGFNNAGMMLFMINKISEAKIHFDKADQLSPNNPVVKNNLGAIALINGDLDEAEALFGAAAGAGKKVSYNLGVVAIKKGDYKSAAKYFAENNDVNAALANILVKNYDAALQKLNANTSDKAMIYYLKAVVGARTDDNNLVFANLKIAIEKEVSLKNTVKTDMEFAKLFEDDNFKSIVKILPDRDL